MTGMTFAEGAKNFSTYGLGEFLEIISELSQESSKKGALERLSKEQITLGLALAKRCERCVTIHSRDVLKLGGDEKDINQLKKIVLFLNAAPWHDDGMFEQWAISWRRFSKAAGPIAPCVRELVALSIAVQRHHGQQLELHVFEALNAGASEEQMVEVMPIVLLMDGAPALSQIPNVMTAIEKYNKLKG